MKIVISGYGKMGKELEEAALVRGYQVLAKLDTPEDWQSQKRQINQADVVLEFSTPDSVVGNIRRCFDLDLPVVVGTTGWYKDEELVKEWCNNEQQTIFVASNFSIGVNILYSLTGHFAKIINQLDEYEVSLEEMHHIHKLDTPSGTAIKLAEIILDRLDRKKNWVNRHQKNPEELQILSVREDEITGIHKICCESDLDKITLKHIAKGRKGFVNGALMAATWLIGKKGYFGMRDLLSLPE